MVTVVVLVLATAALAISTVAFAVACFSPRQMKSTPAVNWESTWRIIPGLVNVNG